MPSSCAPTSWPQSDRRSPDRLTLTAKASATRWARSPPPELRPGLL
jgi:hypothetical protein